MADQTVSQLFPSAPDATDINFNASVQTNSKYQPLNYLLGRVYLPPWVLAKPMKSYIYGDQVQIPAGGSQRLDITLEADAYFLVEQILVTSNQDFSSNDAQNTDIQLSDNTLGQPWSNLPVPLRDLAGFGANSKKLDIGNLLRPSSTLSVNLLNRSSDTQIYYVAVAGRKIYSMSEMETAFLVRRQWYQYVMNVNAISASILGSQFTFQTYMDSDFLLKRLSSYEYLQNAFDAPTDLTVNFRDTTNDRYFFNQKINARLVLGSMYTRIGTTSSNDDLFSYSDTFTFRYPLFIRRNAVILGDWDNETAHGISAFRVVFEGVRVYSNDPILPS